jgi:hypothetical protein
MTPQKKDPSYNLDCPACVEQRIHNRDEWRDFHPHAGEGLDYRNDTRVKGDSGTQKIETPSKVPPTG